MASTVAAPARPHLAAVAWAACLVLGIGLAGCAGQPGAAPATSTASAAASADPTPTEVAAPKFAPTGTATENLAFFNSVVAATLSTDANPPGRTIIDALVEAGFSREDLQLTADTTTKGEPADSIQFSVRFNGECLVGQNGPSSGGYHSLVGPLLANGTCLVGATRQIDW